MIPFFSKSRKSYKSRKNGIPVYWKVAQEMQVDLEKGNTYRNIPKDL